MKLGLFLVILASSALAHSHGNESDLTGLKCGTNYVIHEVSRAPYANNRILIRKSLLGGTSILGYLPLNNKVKEIKEGMNLTNSNEAITYRLNILEETSVFSVELKFKEVDVLLLDNYQFKTNEGFTRLISLPDTVQMGTQQLTHLVITCLPAYR